ncbi:MAG TPA: bifunctional adenosylcobinamide kinase/adenosylcobinamide-phosphate guanylyltransferase [Pilimelia sp.]|nr:bifunctional adenosylcobinamide kinase/adenosylcobinamide-phosphate guanylyltransferase [Pilimelia sp.]
MPVDGWNAVLVLGGIRSGKSEFAESLVADAPGVRYVATAADPPESDPEWSARLAAHRARRPAGWTTVETGADPARLVKVLAEAGPEDTLLVDDLGGWVAAALPRLPQAGAAEGTGQDATGEPAPPAVAADLAAAVRACPGRLVLVSPEVGLSLVPADPVGRAFADALGGVNRAVADACDAVVLVVAGQPSWLKPTAPEVVATAVRDRAAAPPPAPAAPPSGRAPAATAPGTTPAAPAPGTPASAPAPGPASAATTGRTVVAAAVPAAVRVVDAPDDGDDPAVPDIAAGMFLPMPDEAAATDAGERLSRLDTAGGGLGELARVVTFAAGTQGRPDPAAWRSPRLLLLHGDHAGGSAAGHRPGDSARRTAQARAGEGPLAQLAAAAGASLQVVDAPPSAPIEDGPAITPDEAAQALRYGWRLAARAAADGVDVLLLGATSAGTAAAATAVLVATVGAEAAAVLPRVLRPDGSIDDAAWMRRCAAVRDALRRTHRGPRDPHELLAELAGGDVAVATGVLLGGAAHHLPVLLDGPVGAAAGLVTREVASQARHWCLMADHGGSPLVSLVADVLGLKPFTDLRLDLGEGATTLAALPLLTTALELASRMAWPATPPGPAAGA